MKVLDMGSGTGGGFMAVTYWLARRTDRPIRHIEVHCVEPSPFMSEVAADVLTSYNNFLENRLEPLDPFPFQWKQREDLFDIATCAQSDGQRDFDLILFSHTFDEYDPRGWQAKQQEVLQIIKKHLKKTGIVVFLTPDYGNRQIS